MLALLVILFTIKLNAQINISIFEKYFPYISKIILKIFITDDLPNFYCIPLSFLKNIRTKIMN